MPATIDDAGVLAEYVRTRSAEALGRLIENHIDFVFAAAVRQTGDHALAEDVTQAVFIVLARKAKSIPPAGLAGWLFRTTRYCAANARRSERRRRRHERLASRPEVDMKCDNSSTLQLDDALSRLNGRDREVVLLRYLQQRDFSEVSSILGISEPTARQRLARAIERLRRLMASGREMVPAALVVSTLTGAAVKAPAHLAGLTITAAVGKGVGGSAAAALAGRTIHLLTWLKLQTVMAIVIAGAVAGTAGVAAVKRMAPAAQTPIQEAVSEPATAAPLATQDGAVATFPDGLRVEVLGVNNHPSNKTKWWKPDGSPLDKPPYRKFNGGVSGGPGFKGYEFAVGVRGAKADSSTGINIADANGSASTYNGTVNSIAVLLLPKPTATVNFQCATGPWQTRLTIPADAVIHTGFTIDNISFALGMDKKNASIVMVANYATLNAISDGDLAYVAIGLDGKTYTSGQMSSQGTTFTETIDISFPKVRMEQVKEFQIRTRPFNRTVEFENVSLIPGHRTSPQFTVRESGGFEAAFMGGGSVEIVGLSDAAAAGKWWRPDGSPLAEIPVEKGPKLGADRAGEHSFLVAVRRTGGGDDPSDQWAFPSSKSVIVINKLQDRGWPGLDIYGVAFPAGQESAEFRVGVASGVWSPAARVAASDKVTDVSVGGDVVSFSAPREDGGDLIVTTTDQTAVDPQHEVQRRLVAMDMNGTTHVAQLVQSVDAKGENTFRFSQLSKDKVRSYELQTRRYEYVKFGGLSLAPGKLSEVKIEPDEAPIAVAEPAGL